MSSSLSEADRCADSESSCGSGTAASRRLRSVGSSDRLPCWGWSLWRSLGGSRPASRLREPPFNRRAANAVLGPSRWLRGHLLRRSRTGVAPVALRRRIALGRCRQHSAPHARIDRPVDKLRASHPAPASAPSQPDFLAATLRLSFTPPAAPPYEGPRTGSGSAERAG